LDSNVPQSMTVIWPEAGRMKILWGRKSSNTYPPW